MNSKEIVAYECGKCKKTYTDKKTAEDCCMPYICKNCGVETPRYKLMCEPCYINHLYEKAEKLTHWDGWISCEGINHNEGYFENVEELLEYCEDEEIQVPDWVFICKSQKHELNLDNALENMLDDAYEDAYDHLVDVKGLTEFIDKWNDKQDIVTYYPDYGKVLIISK